MPTRLQEKLADEIIKDLKRPKPRQAKDLLVSAGYDETTALASPGRTIEQKGVKKALKNRGFSEDNAKKVVSEILLDKKQKGDTRINAAKEIFKVHGSYAPEKSFSLNVEVQANPEIKALTNKLNEIYRGTSG